MTRNTKISYNAYGIGGPIRRLRRHPCGIKISLTICSNRVHTSINSTAGQLLQVVPPLLRLSGIGTEDACPDQEVIERKAAALLAAATVLALLVTCLGRHRSCISRDAIGRYFFLGASAAYFSLISYVFSYLTTYMPEVWKQPLILMLVVLLQFLKSNADMSALAVAALASPMAGDDIDSQKIRPSMESLVSTLWVAGLIIYYTVLAYGKLDDDDLRAVVNLRIFLLWMPGVARMVLRFVAFQRVNASFAVGRNAQLIEGYMAQLQEEGEGHLVRVPRLTLTGERDGDQFVRVPRLIVTGEKKLDVEESPQGYRIPVKEDQSSRLVTLDKVWSSSRLSPEVKDLCLSFSLFKCLRRRFAGYRLAEAGSSWAFRFVCDGLLGQEDNHERMFRVIAGELSFASSFYYAPRPVASLGAWSAALHFFLSALIWISILTMLISGFLAVFELYAEHDPETILVFLILLVGLVTLTVEIVDMVSSVRSNWTKISMVGHLINESCCACIICSCLLRCKSPVHWKDEIGQNLLLKPSLPRAHLFKQIFLPSKNRYKPVIMVSPDVKHAVIRSLKRSGGKLSNGVATVQRWCSPHFTWEFYNRVTTSTDTILVWYIATFLVEINCSSPDSVPTTDMLVATSLSRYCTYLVADAPDLLPDNNPTWTMHRYEKVKKCIEATCSRSGAASRPDLYSHPIESFGDDNSNDNEMVEIGIESRRGNDLTEGEVVKIGSKLGKQLVEEVNRQRESHGQDQEQRTRGEQAVWEILAEFWSEMILYLAPSDNVTGHIEALRHDGELITLLWALLLHAGITSRPGHDVTHP